MMKRMITAVALILMVGAANQAWGHDSACAHTHYAVNVGNYTYESSSCDNPGASCNYAPCGEVGRCQLISYFNTEIEDCNCQQVEYGASVYLNTGGLHLGTVPPTTLAVGMVSTIQFIPSSPWNELVVNLNDNTELARIGAISGGSLEIRWQAEDAEYLYGVLSFFDLVFPGYDFEGQPTGENHWFFAGPDWEVQLSREDGRIMLGQPLPLAQTNDLWSEMGWLDMILDVHHADEEAILIDLHATMGDPQPVPVAPENWSAIKQRYE